MFLALAIVCDEFFVPALELFVDVLTICVLIGKPVCKLVTVFYGKS